MAAIPTIISTPDATHYLVGQTDNNENFMPLTGLNQVAICQSLLGAKQLLREHNIAQAQLTFESAYDEMCGLPSTGTINQTISI